MPRRRPRPTQKVRAERASTLAIPREHSGGRPSSITPVTQKLMLQAVTAGLPIHLACTFAGITTYAHRRAITIGRQAQQRYDEGQPVDTTAEMYRQYVAAIEKARADLGVRAIQLVNKVAEGGQLISEEREEWYDENGKKHVKTDRKYTAPSFPAVKFLLEKSFPADFTKPEQLELSGRDGGPIETKTAAVDAVVITTLAERVKEIRMRNQREIEAGEIDEDGAPIVIDEDGNRLEETG